MAARKKVGAADAVDAQLERYRSMRDFSVTDEPSGKTKSKAPEGLPFCVQKHAASHLHYDFRLGWNGVLKSWACAKGPSYHVGDRRLAVQVEDHPIDYGGFEGIIPAGQYGGGTVMLWDQGTWHPQDESKDVDAALRDGHLKFVLEGTKLKGKWALIRMKPRTESEKKKPAWLLIKEHDEFEQPVDAEAVTEAEPNSVVTGRTIDEIAANKDHVWNSGGAKRGLAKTFDLAALPKEHQPSFLKPELAVETKTPPAGEGWLHELKLDGYRMQARKDGSKVAMLTRTGLDWTARMSGIAVEVAKLPCASATLDGEVVVLGDDGNTSFAELQAAFQDGARHPLTYFCFDLLHLEGHNTRGLPLVERKKLLQTLLEDADEGTLRFSEHLRTSSAKLFEQACSLGAEGIVSKRADAKYSGTRNAGWLKAKCRREQEFVIGGFTLPGKGKAGGPGIGALLLGYYDDHKRLIYAGRTGTGFTAKVSADLRKQLEALRTEKAVFASVPAEARRGAIWVHPKLVGQVHFATWTADNLVRQAAFLGLREDKPPASVRREVTVAKSVQTKVKAVAAGAKPAKAASPAQMQAAPVRLTHPEKVLDPASGMTKRQLADFYWAVSENMLPHIAGRALSLVRVPEGIGKPQFFQRHMNATMPPGFEAVDIPDAKTGEMEKYITLHSREAIASFAQMAVLEVHPWGSMASDLERPDRLVFDLDPDEALHWATLADGAKEVRKQLKKRGLESFLKTTGGKGLHVVVPIEPEHGWPQIKEFCHQFVLKMEAADPKKYLTKMTKSARAGKIFLDYLRNERSATAVAPWSPRARPNVGVAVPLRWPELDAAERPHFNVGNFAEWQERLKKDPWAKMAQTKQRLVL